MKTKKLDFLMIFAIVILAAVLVPIIKFLPFFHRRGELRIHGEGEFFQGFPTPGGNLRLIETNLEIRIPPSASEIHAFLGGPNQPLARARFNLPPPDFPMFIHSTFCDQPFVVLNPRDLPMDEDDPDWWQPQDSSELVECVGATPYSRQQILVDRSNRNSLVIYVLTLMGHFEFPAE